MPEIGETTACPICNLRVGSMICISCTSTALQQRRTAVAAMRADVAVLKRKCNSFCENKDSSEEKNLEQLELLKCDLMAARQQLCTDRILLAQKRQRIEERMHSVVNTRKEIEEIQNDVHALRQPILEGLNRHISWHEVTTCRSRKERVLELFSFFGVETPLKNPDSKIAVITGLPLPRSGNYEHIPAEVVAAALGRIIHFLSLIQKYLSIKVFSQPMAFNSSFSTIGSSEGEGATCHTLYPDGTLGFERGLLMLQKNVLHLCVSQGMDVESLYPPPDLLGNLALLGQCPRLGVKE